MNNWRNVKLSSVLLGVNSHIRASIALIITGKKGERAAHGPGIFSP